MKWTSPGGASRWGKVQATQRAEQRGETRHQPQSRRCTVSTRGAVRETRRSRNPCQLTGQQTALVCENGRRCAPRRLFQSFTEPISSHCLVPLCSRKRTPSRSWDLTKIKTHLPRSQILALPSICRKDHRAVDATPEPGLGTVPHVRRCNPLLPLTSDDHGKVK